MRDLALQLELSTADRAQVERWLEDGAPDFDPDVIPRAHREAFLAAFLEVATADGRFDTEESDLLRVLRELLV